MLCYKYISINILFCLLLFNNKHMLCNLISINMNKHLLGANSLAHFLVVWASFESTHGPKSISSIFQARGLMSSLVMHFFLLCCMDCCDGIGFVGN